MTDVTTWLLITGTAITGLGAGATLDQAIKQLPARRRIGAAAYAEYMRAADLGNGLVWYPILGIGTTLATVAVAVALLLANRSGATTAGLVAIMAGLVVQVAASVRAAPKLLGLRRGADPETVIDSFARSNTVRAVAVMVTLVALAYTLAAWVAQG